MRDTPVPTGPVGASALRVGVIGSIISIDFALANAMLGAEIETVVLRSASEPAPDDRAQVFPRVSDEHIAYFSSRTDLLRQLRTYDVVFSFTAAIGFWLGRRMYGYPILRRLGWPPYINMSTGSDAAERALERSRPGMLQRFTMRHAFAQALPPFPDVIHTAAKLRLNNVCVLPHVHVSFSEPEGAAPPNGATWRFRQSQDELLLFHPSNLDWAEADPGPRASTKGNDRFIRALARFVPECSRPVRVVILDRGPDRKGARQLVQSLGLDEVVTWGPDLTRPELFAAMREADVVVDQFDVGAFGGIALEALSRGRPVLTYVQETCEKLVYDENSPVLNAHTEDEILERLREATDPEQLSRRAEESRRWVEARGFESLLPRYLLYATLATGKPAADFGWNRPHGTLDSYS